MAYLVNFICWLFQAFVYCSYGANNIYYATLVTSVCALVTCVLIGCFAQRVSRPKLALPMYGVIVLAIALLVIFSDMREAVYYVIAAILGVSTAVLNVHVHCEYISNFGKYLNIHSF